MLKKILDYLKKADYKTYFIITWIFSYFVVNFLLGVRTEEDGYLAYQPFTVVIFSFTYIYSRVAYYAIKTPVEEMTLIRSCLKALFIFIELGIFLELMDNICKFAYDNGLDIWFLWGL